MATSARSPAALRIRQDLGGALRILRLRKDLTATELARRTGMSISKISKVELGQVASSEATIRQIAAALDATDEELQQLIAHVRAEQIANLPKQEDLRNIEGWKEAWVEPYEAASLVRMNVRLGIPAPFWTSALIRSRSLELNYSFDELRTTRLRQQRLLWSEHHRFIFIFRETELGTLTLGRQDRHAQISQILTFSELPNVDVRLVPSFVKESTVIHDFALLDDNLVIVEASGWSQLLHQPEEIARFVDIFDRVSAYALSGDSAREAMQRSIEDSDDKIDIRSASVHQG